MVVVGGTEVVVVGRGTVVVGRAVVGTGTVARGGVVGTVVRNGATVITGIVLVVVDSTVVEGAGGPVETVDFRPSSSMEAV